MSATKLTVDLIAQVGGFVAGMKQASAAADREFGKITSAAKKIGVGAGAALAAATSAATFAVKRAIDEADRLSKAAQKVGIPTEVLSELKFAADLSGVAFESLQQQLGRLIKTQTEAAQGSGRAAEVFKALGLSARDASGELTKTPDLLASIADRFKSLPDGALKSQLAVELFGRAGRDLIPLLNGGSEGLKQFSDEARRLGVVVDTETGRKAEEFNDQLTRVQAALEGAALSAASKLLPALTQTNGPLDKLVGLLKDPGFQEGFSTLITGALNAAAALARFASEVANVVKFAAEEIAFKVTGKASADDIVRLEEQAENLRARLARNGDTILTTPLGFSKEKRAELEQELRNTEALIKDYYDGIAAQQRRAAELAAGINAPVTVSAGQVDTSALQGLFKPPSGGGRGRAASEAARAAREEARAAEERRKAYDEFIMTLQDLEAQVSGPLAQAELEWDRRKTQLEELAARGQISAEQEQRALEALAVLREKDVAAIRAQQEAIEAQLTPAQELIETLQFELDLLSRSPLEREIEIAKRYAGADATQEQIDKIRELIRLQDEARKKAQAADDLRRGFSDAFASVLDGTKSAKQALEDLGSYITQLIARRLADQLVESLFGPMGTPLGGSAGGSGNLFGQVLGALFGGGRAAGGYVAPGKLYQVAENGPELLRVGNRQFLLPTVTGGTVQANPRLGGGGSVTQNITVVGRLESRTATHLAQETNRALRRSMARFGA